MGPDTYNKFNGRLAQFKRISNIHNFWKERWSNKNIKQILENYSKGKLDEYDAIFSQYLPKDLPILEAGCGVGQIVMALKSLGYCVEGVDCEEDTINRITQIAPDLNVRVGDINNLDIPDETYGGYISLGVMEHNPDGPLRALKEAARILHKEGVALISVPYLNTIRKKMLKNAQETQFPDSSNKLKFYQYYFSKKEFEDLLFKAGLEVIEMFPHAVFASITRDFSLGRRLYQHGFFVYRIHKVVSRLCANSPYWTRYHFGHMVMFVCRPLR